MSDETPIERLYVDNFGGIKKAEIEFSRMNVFIGPQATGKSVCAKLLYYLRTILIGTGDFKEQSKADITRGHADRFARYFPSLSWPSGSFSVHYQWGSDVWVTISRESSDSQAIEITYSDRVREINDTLLRTVSEINKMLRERKNGQQVLDPERFAAQQSLSNEVVEALEWVRSRLIGNNIYFVPAGRSFFSVIQSNIFTFIAGNVRFDPFIAEFGRRYEFSQNLFQLQQELKDPASDQSTERRISRLLSGTFFSDNGMASIKSADGRSTPLLYSSSGQQEVLPLVVMASEASANSVSTTLLIEEPETHLYPAAQREIMHLLTSAIDLRSESRHDQYVITTHSPYVLSSVNNLMYGGKIIGQSPKKRARVEAVLGDAALLDPDKVRAYYFDNGKCRSIIDPETGLIEAKALDQVSNELAREFEDLMNIEFEDKKVA